MQLHLRYASKQLACRKPISVCGDFEKADSLAPGRLLSALRRSSEAAGMAQTSLERVEPSTVAKAIREESSEIAVVDVRNSEEFSIGHVKGALNLDSTAFTDNSLLDKLVEQLQNKSQVVVHCAKSLQRGPQSAALLQQRLQELGLAQQVVVLDGGFNKFSELYQADASVVEAGAAPKLAAAAPADQH